MNGLRARVRSRGFSLLEVLVAFVIMALALGVLYQTLGGSVRASGRADLAVRAALVAESVLALHESVPPQGIHASGEDGGFAWTLTSAPLPGLDDFPAAWQLHELVADVSWGEDGHYRLLTIRPEVEPDQLVLRQGK